MGRTRTTHPERRTASHCAGCLRAAECVRPCARLEAVLPGPRRGERFLPIPNEIAESAGQWRRDAGRERRKIFRIFLAHRAQLSKRQWRCVELVYGEDLSPAEAAREIGVLHSTVVRHVRAAQRKIARKVCTDLRTGGEAR